MYWIIPSNIHRDQFIEYLTLIILQYHELFFAFKYEKYIVYLITHVQVFIIGKTTRDCYQYIISCDDEEVSLNFNL